MLTSTKRKKSNRLKRARRIRARVYLAGKPRLTIHKTSSHIYAQLFDCSGSVVHAQCSTLEATVKSEVTKSGNKQAASVVGRLIGKRCLELGFSEVSFDRSGFSYHGRVQALADAAREQGLKF